MSFKVYQMSGTGPKITRKYKCGLTMTPMSLVYEMKHPDKVDLFLSVGYCDTALSGFIALAGIILLLLEVSIFGHVVG